MMMFCFIIVIIQRAESPRDSLGDALNALKFHRVQHDSLSEPFLWDNMFYNQCKGKSL